MATQYNTGAGYYSPSSPKPDLPRSISTTNLETTKRCRAVIQQDWCSTVPMGGTNFFTSTPCFTLTLPALTDYPTEFQQFVFERIIDKETQRALEGEKCLNWCPSATKLVPLYTLGDGNCLLHAASLGMWGFQDRDHILRRAVAHACFNTEGNTFYRRWQYNREQENLQFGLQLEQPQWQREWEIVVNQASAEVPARGNLESLEEFHIFVLANVLRRPVVMYAVPKMRSVQGATLQGVNFHGIYLPLLWDPHSCKKDPLPLSFYGGHFSALVVIDSPGQYRNGYLVLPLTDYYGQQLPIRFALPQEDPTSLMMDYLNLMQIQNHGSPYFQHHVVCAKMMIADIPAYLKPLISGFIDACHSSYVTQVQTQTQQQLYQSNSAAGPMAAPVQSGSGDSGPRCINNCGMTGNPDTAGLCSQCYKKAQTEAQSQERERVSTGQQYPYGNEAGRQLGVAQPSGQTSQQASPISSSQGSIKCPHCTNPGHPMYLGMCENCYRRTTMGHQPQQQYMQQPPRSFQQQADLQPQGQKDDTYESLSNYQPAASQVKAKPPAVPPPRAENASGGRSKCRMHGCEFFGTAETRYYCSKCFNDNLENILKEVDGPPTHPPSRSPVGGVAPPMCDPTRLSSVPPTQLPQQTFTAPVTSGGVYGQPLRVPNPQPYEVPIAARNSPSTGDAGGQEPPKCSNCRQFFANEEFGWLCHGCFMKKTEVEAVGKNQLNPLNNPPQPAYSRAYTEPQRNFQIQPQYGQQQQQYEQQPQYGQQQQQYERQPQYRQQQQQYERQPQYGQQQYERQQPQYGQQQQQYEQQPQYGQQQQQYERQPQYRQQQQQYERQPQYGQQQQQYQQPSPPPAAAYTQIRRCANTSCDHTASEGSIFCAPCNMQQNLPEPATEFRPPPTQSQKLFPQAHSHTQPQMQPASQEKPTPKPRRNVTQTRPAANLPMVQARGTTNDLSGAIENMSLSGGQQFPCFLCQGTSPLSGGDQSYAVCPKHASMMKSFLKQQPTDMPHGDETVRQKPVTAPYNHPGSYPDNVAPNQNPSVGASNPYPGFPSPHSAGYSATSVHTGPQASSYSHAQYQPVHSQPDPTYQRREMYTDRNHSTYTTQPYSTYAGGPHYTHANTSHYQTTPSPGTQQGRQPPAGAVATPFTAANQPYPPHQQQQPLQYYDDRGMFNSSDEPKRKPLPQQQPPQQQPPQQQYMMSGGREHAQVARVLSSGGGEGRGIYGGGGSAYGGAEGGGPAPGQTMPQDTDMKPAKQLCGIAGCSFKAVPELGGLCPDCYDEHYKKPNT